MPPRVGELTGLGRRRAATAGLLTPRWRPRWLDDGIAPNGATRAGVHHGQSVHGFDLTFAAPKSVSLLRALTDDVSEKAVAEPRISGQSTPR